MNGNLYIIYHVIFCSDMASISYCEIEQMYYTRHIIYNIYENDIRFKRCM